MSVHERLCSCRDMGYSQSCGPLSATNTAPIISVYPNETLILGTPHVLRILVVSSDRGRLTLPKLGLEDLGL